MSFIRCSSASESLNVIVITLKNLTMTIAWLLYQNSDNIDAYDMKRAENRRIERVSQKVFHETRFLVEKSTKTKEQREEESE